VEEPKDGSRGRHTLSTESQRLTTEPIPKCISAACHLSEFATSSVVCGVFCLAKGVEHMVCSQLGAKSQAAKSAGFATFGSAGVAVPEFGTPGICCNFGMLARSIDIILRYL